MKKLVKGVRLNDDNRRIIARAVVDSRIGKEIEKAKGFQEDLALDIQGLLVEKLVTPENVESVLDAKGIMPTVSTIVFEVGGIDTPRLDLPFANEVQVPWAFFEPYGKGAISETGMEVLKEDDEVFQDLTDRATFYRDTMKNDREMMSKMMTFLRGFTSPPKLLEANPNLEDFLPNEMWEETEAVESVSLDDILAA